MKTINYTVNVPHSAAAAIIAEWNTHSSNAELIDNPSSSLCSKVDDDTTQVSETFADDETESTLHHAACDLEDEWKNVLGRDDVEFKLVSIG